jgi:hypothetical protein
MFDYASGKISEVSFFDENNPSRPWSAYTREADRPVDTEVDLLSPVRLKEAHEKGELSGPLADIAATIKEDDNPVVRIIKFK